MPFRNRSDAGRKLAAALAGYKQQHPAILALPRGGAVVAAEVARALQAPLDLVIVRKIGAPGQPELAMGAVAGGNRPLVVRNEDVIRRTQVSRAAFDHVLAEELTEVERRRRLYLGERPPVDVRDRLVIVVDDGIATGATTRAGLRAIRARGPKAVVLAVPVAPPEILAEMREEADDVVCLEADENFGAIGFYYDDFRQTADAEVIAIMREAAADEGRRRDEAEGSAPAH